jgi:signal transduction histidine kinase
MRVLKDAPIKQKLIMISLLTAGCALVLSALALTLNEVIVFKKALLNELAIETEIIGSNCTAALTFNDAKAATEILTALKANRSIDLASIYTKGGTLFANYSRGGENRDMSQRTQKEGHQFGLNYVKLYHDIVLDNEVIGSIYIYSDLNELYANLFRYAGIFLAAILLSLCAVYLLSSRLQKTMTGIISDLVRTMNTVSEEKDYSVRTAVQSKDELGELAEGFNEMLIQIQSRDSELEAYRKDLEELVDRRTGELKTANEQLQRSLTEREKAEEEVLRLNEELEMKVEERTMQLIDAQEELVRKEKLATLGQLSGSVGHELRNPMGVISNAVYFLQTVMPDADKTVREYLDIIKSEVNNSQRIITDLLDFTRTKTPRTKPVTVNEVISRSLEKCVLPESVAVNCFIEEGLPLIKVDPFQTGQVFQNLIMNAVQAMPEGGNLRIDARLSPPHPSLDKGGQGLVEDFIEISVTDTGKGISPDNLTKIFQPLFTTKAKGIGLGLTVCKRLTEANGGRIEVESNSGGTTFTVMLPVNGGQE